MCIGMQPCLLVVLSVGEECGSFPSMMNQLNGAKGLPKISFGEEIKQLFCWPMEKKVDGMVSRLPAVIKWTG